MDTYSLGLGRHPILSTIQTAHALIAGWGKLNYEFKKYLTLTKRHIMITPTMKKNIAAKEAAAKVEEPVEVAPEQIKPEAPAKKAVKKAPAKKRRARKASGKKD